MPESTKFSLNDALPSSRGKPDKQSLKQYDMEAWNNQCCQLLDENSIVFSTIYTNFSSRRILTNISLQVFVSTIHIIFSAPTLVEWRFGVRKAIRLLKIPHQRSPNISVGTFGGLPTNSSNMKQPIQPVVHVCVCPCSSLPISK